MMGAEFDSYAGDYDAQHRQSIALSGETPEYFANYKARELARLARVWGFEKPKLLDFGSGIGNSIPALRRHLPLSQVTSADVSAESLQAARDRYGDCEAQLLITTGTLPAEDGSFDLTFVACVFHHIPHEEHHAWLGEVRRVTRKGGRIVIFEHNPVNPLTRHAVRNCQFDENAHLITAGQMRAQLAQSGWSDVQTDYHVFFPAALSGLRRLEPRLRWCGIGAQYACHARNPAEA